VKRKLIIGVFLGMIRMSAMDIVCPIEKEVLKKCNDERFAAHMQSIMKETQEINTLFSKAWEWYLCAVATQNEDNIINFLAAHKQQTMQKIDLSDTSTLHDKNNAQATNNKYRATILCNVLEARRALQDDLDALHLALSLAKRAELRAEKEKNEQFLQQLENK